MLIKSDLKGCPEHCQLHYICKRCGGNHYFYGSATPENLDECRLCLSDGGRGWINRITGSNCHILAGNQATLRDHRKIRKLLEVIRNNPGPYKRESR